MKENKSSKIWLSGDADFIMTEIIKTNVVVIGGGAAGLRSALEAAAQGREVLVLSKGVVGKSGITPLASFGISAAVNNDDSIDRHLEESLRVAQGIGNPKLLQILAQESPARLKDLVAYGLTFKMEDDGRFYHPVRAGKRDNHTCCINGGGFSLNQALRRAAEASPRIRILNDTMALKIVKEDDQVVGLVVLDIASGKLAAVSAASVILATGGYEELWHFTDTSTDSTGEGICLAMDAGADLVDLEMVLFYPLVMIHPPSAIGCSVPYDLATNINARLLDGRMRDLSTKALSPFDLIKTAYRAIRSGSATPNGGIYFKVECEMPETQIIEIIKERMGVRFTHLQKMGISLHRDRIEMSPASHYCLGGVQIDEDGRTNIKGLFATGEVSGNIHGAGRVFSNALAETQVFGYRAGRAVTSNARNGDFSEPLAKVEKEIQEVCSGFKSPAAIRSDLKMIMWTLAGPVRHGDLMTEALNRIIELSHNNMRVKRDTFCQQLVAALEVKAMIRLAEAVVRSGLERTESRGHHFRDDYPQMDDGWRAHTRVRILKDEMIIDKIPA
ncbi:MAG: FAD-dependent oxidoreductase [Thermodesulfobacteriota bacterium]